MTVASSSPSRPARATEARQIVRFILVLVVGAVIDLAVLNLVLRLATPATAADSSLITLVASAAGFTSGLVSNYLLHRCWTFQAAAHLPVRHQLPRFVAISLSALGIRLLLVALLFPLAQQAGNRFVTEPGLLQTLSANAAQLAAMGVSVLWNYYANRRWTYRTPQAG